MVAEDNKKVKKKGYGEAVKDKKELHDRAGCIRRNDQNL